MTQIASLLAAFFTGILTFFATCLLPVLPAYIGFLGGVSVTRSGSIAESGTRRRIFVHSIFFVIGFLLVFSTLGLAATAAGAYFASHREPFQKIGGIFLIFLGLIMAGFLKAPFMLKTWKIHFDSMRHRATNLSAFLLGLTFGFAWTPCIGPVLATILFLASQAQTKIVGTIHLAVFALGLGIPFLVVGYFFDTLSPILRRSGRSAALLAKIFGLSIVGIGILLITGHLALLSEWSLRWGASLVL